MNGVVADHRQESDVAWLLCAALACHLAPHVHEYRDRHPPHSCSLPLASLALPALSLALLPRSRSPWPATAELRADMAAEQCFPSLHQQLYDPLLSLARTLVRAGARAVLAHAPARRPSLERLHSELRGQAKAGCGQAQAMHGRKVAVVIEPESSHGSLERRRGPNGGAVGVLDGDAVGRELQRSSAIGDGRGAVGDPDAGLGRRVEHGRRGSPVTAPPAARSRCR